MNATPLFVLGKHRSGTTWLANELCRHPAIAGAREDGDGSIIESLFFSHLDGRFGRITDGDAYRRLVDLLVDSRYGRAVGASADRLLALRPTTYEAFLRAVMEDFAKERGASYWLEKSPGHTPAIRRLAEAYPDAKFVAIERDPHQVAASTLAFTSARRGIARPIRLRRASAILRMMITWSYYTTTLRDFDRHSDRLFLTTYEDLVSDRERVLAEVHDFLGLTPRMFDSPVQHRNSSFSSDEARRGALSPAESRLVDLSAALLLQVPPTIMSAVHRASSALAPPRPLPAWYVIGDGDERAARRRTGGTPR